MSKSHSVLGAQADLLIFRVKLPYLSCRELLGQTSGSGISVDRGFKFAREPHKKGRLLISQHRDSFISSASVLGGSEPFATTRDHATRDMFGSKVRKKHVLFLGLSFWGDALLVWLNRKPQDILRVQFLILKHTLCLHVDGTFSFMRVF